jgi:hypothetical protein
MTISVDSPIPHRTDTIELFWRNIPLSLKTIISLFNLVALLEDAYYETKNSNERKLELEHAEAQAIQMAEKGVIQLELAIGVTIFADSKRSKNLHQSDFCEFTEPEVASGWKILMSQHRSSFCLRVLKYSHE